MIRSLVILLICLVILTGCSLRIEQKYNIAAANVNAKLGLAYLQQNKIALAKNKLLTAYKQAPNDARVHDALGCFFAHTGEPALAEENYLYAIKHADEKGAIWHNYGIFLYQQHRYLAALKYFLLAAKDTNYLFIAKAYANASDAALKLKQHNLARQCRKKAILYDPIVFFKVLSKY